MRLYRVLGGSSPDSVDAVRIVSGIDVSRRQGDVNWHAVVEAGISFAFAKAIEGSIFIDPQFNVNWAGMRRAGIPACIPFLPAGKTSRDAVENFVKAVRELETGNLPPVLDLEEALTSQRR